MVEVTFSLLSTLPLLSNGAQRIARKAEDLSLPFPTNLTRSMLVFFTFLIPSPLLKVCLRATVARQSPTGVLRLQNACGFVAVDFMLPEELVRRSIVFKTLEVATSRN